MKRNLPALWLLIKCLIGYETLDKRNRCRRYLRLAMHGRYHDFIQEAVFMGHWTGVHRLNDEQKQKILDNEPF